MAQYRRLKFNRRKKAKRVDVWQKEGWRFLGAATGAMQLNGDMVISGPAKLYYKPVDGDSTWLEYNPLTDEEAAKLEGSETFREIAERLTDKTFTLTGTFTPDPEALEPLDAWDQLIWGSRLN